jgi:carboxymethylenebutenolidase
VAKFAAHGYIALAPDMFSRWDGDQEALTRGDISVRISDVDIRSYMGDSLDHLLTYPHCNHQDGSEEPIVPGPNQLMRGPK